MSPRCLRELWGGSKRVMTRLETSAFEIAQRFVGITEMPGAASNPEILRMLQLDADWPQDDTVPWCSAFVNYVAWLLRLPRSKSLRARSWLAVGEIISLDEAKPGLDVVILKRGDDPQPGPEVIRAPGHVGFFAGVEGELIFILGGNQRDSVSIAPCALKDLLGVRRLA